MKIGIDLVEIDKISNSILNSPLFLDKLLTPIEQEGSVETISGRIAAKEALLKCGYISLGKWLEVEISHTESGAPVVKKMNGEIDNNVQISITHTSKYACALAIYAQA